jgi:hypothetical protein
VIREGLLGTAITTIVVLALCSTARADFQVERSEGAGSCPDPTAFTERLRERGGPADGAAIANIRVRFEHTPKGYRSSVQVAGGKPRSLVDDTPSCDGLAEATALAVKLALDLDAARSIAPVRAPPTEHAPEDRPREKSRPAPIDEPIAASLGDISLASVVAFGIATPVAPGVRAGAAMVLDRRERWSLGLTGLFLPSQSRIIGEGAVDLSVQGGGVEGCGRARAGRSLLLALCGRLEMMRVEGDARGFTRSESHARALPASTVLGRARARVAGPLVTFAEVGAIAPFFRHRFSVDTVGVVYDPPVIGATVGIGVAIDFE